MNKKEFIKEVAGKTGMTQKDMAIIVDAFIDTVTETLVTGERIQFTGFGAFEVRDRAERQGHNPATGEAMTIPASKTPAFKASKNLRDAVNGR